MRSLTVAVCSLLLASIGWAQQPHVAERKPKTPQAQAGEKETRYLAFQIFTYSPNPKSGSMGEGSNYQNAGLPSKAALGAYIDDIKTRIGAVGDTQTKSWCARG